MERPIKYVKANITNSCVPACLAMVTGKTLTRIIKEIYEHWENEGRYQGVDDDIVDQGIDLDTIYSPYKQTMASILEINPDSISLNDPTLRMGIGPDKEVSLYEYQRMLRKDPRWQYTNNAREDVANSVLTVARNFGFQG